MSNRSVKYFCEQNHREFRQRVRVEVSGGSMTRSGKRAFMTTIFRHAFYLTYGSAPICCPLFPLHPCQSTMTAAHRRNSHQASHLPHSPALGSRWPALFTTYHSRRSPHTNQDRWLYILSLTKEHSPRMSCCHVIRQDLPCHF